MGNQKSNLNTNEVPTQIKNPELVQQRRKQIIDSTVKLFIEHGYHKTTTRMIAKASGFSIGSLYEYISSKKNLLYLVCHTIHGEVQIAVEAALSRQGDERERLAEVIREYLLICDTMSDHILLMYQVTQFLPKKWEANVLQNELNITKIFIDILKELFSKGSFPGLDDKALNLMGHNISVLGHMWAFRRWNIENDYSIDEYIEIQTYFIMSLAFVKK